MGSTCITSAFSLKRDKAPLSPFSSSVKANLALFHPLATTEPTTTFLLFLRGTLSGLSGLDAAGTADGFWTYSFTSPSQGDAPRVTISERLHTYISFTEGMSGAFSLSLFPQQNKMLLRSLHWEIWQGLKPSSEVILEQMTQKPFRLLSPHQSWRKVNFVLNSDQNPIQSLKGKLALRLKT